MNRLLVIFFAACFIGPVLAEEDPADFPRKIEALASTEEKKSSLERRNSFVRLYRAEFPGPLGTTDAHALSVRLNAAISTVFYSKDPGIAREVVITYRALAALGGAEDGDFDDVIKSLIKAREFEWADALLAEYGRPPLPLVNFGALAKRGGVRKVMVISNSHITVEPLEEAQLGNGIIVVSNPLCGYSNAASTAISLDPVLAEGFEDALWLVPPEGDLRVREVGDWNRAHPSQRMVLTYDWLDWPEIDDWSTPAFYFFAGGRLVEKVIGWPLDGSRASRLHGAVERWEEAKSDAEHTNFR